MKIQYLYPSIKGFGYLLLLGCLVLTVSCNNTPQNIGLPIGSTYDGGSVEIDCISPYRKELHSFEMIPEKIKSQAKMALLEYLEPDEIDRQLEFVAFKSYAETGKLKKYKLKNCAYSMHYIRHIDNGVISSLGIRLIFDNEQEYKSQYGFGNLKADSPNKNYISKSTLKKILKQHNYSRYDKVALQLLPDDVPKLTFTKNPIFTYKTILRKKVTSIKPGSKAWVDLRTGEFNSKEE